VNVIFLDFDGVLNCPGCHGHPHNDHKAEAIVSLRGRIGKSHVAALNKLWENAPSNPIVVISSTWRLMPLARTTLSGLLRKAGFVGYVDSCTPFSNQTMNRGNEIAQWIRDLRPSLRKQVESLVILDDDSDMGDLMPRLVQTSFRVGLVEEEIQTAIEVLNTPFDMSEIKHMGAPEARYG